MPKISERTVRNLRRALVVADSRVSKAEQKLDSVVKKAAATNEAYRNCLKKIYGEHRRLHKNMQSWRELFSKQQLRLREQQSRLLSFEQLQRKQDNISRQMARDTQQVAAAMIAMSQQVCSACLGARTVLKTKKNIRYSVECQQCK